MGLTMRVEHRPGALTPRLWAPDQLLGAYGAMRAGRPAYWNLLARTGNLHITHVDNLEGTVDGPSAPPRARASRWRAAYRLKKVAGAYF